MDIFKIQLLINFSTEIDCAGCAFTHSRFDRLNDHQGNKPVTIIVTNTLPVEFLTVGELSNYELNKGR